MNSAFLKPYILQAAFLAVQTLVYFGVERFEGPPHDVSRPIDERIPFQPAWVFIYILWFPLIFLFPPAVYFADRALHARYLFSAAADIVISTVIYLAYPTSFQRPAPPDTFSGRVMGLVYSGSYRGVNCMPSMHCSMCYLVIVTAVLCGGMPLPGRCAAVIVSVLIVISTMTTKQHVFLDALSAVPVAAVCWLIGGALC